MHALEHRRRARPLQECRSRFPRVWKQKDSCRLNVPAAIAIFLESRLLGSPKSYICLTKCLYELLSLFICKEASLGSLFYPSKNEVCPNLQSPQLPISKPYPIVYEQQATPNKANTDSFRRDTCFGQMREPCFRKHSRDAVLLTEALCPVPRITAEREYDHIARISSRLRTSYIKIKIITNYRARLKVVTYMPPYTAR